MVGQFQQHIGHIVNRHIGRHRPHNYSRTAVVLGLDAGLGQQFKVVKHGLLFGRAQIDLHRHQQHLGRHIAVTGRELFKQNPFMGGVFVNQAELASALGDDVGLEDFADKPQRFGFGRRRERNLLRVGQGGKPPGQVRAPLPG